MAAGPAAAVTGRLDALRARRPLLDHVVRMQEHYGAVRATQQAGAVTYFAFLSFFPLLALSVFVVGRISLVYPDADAALRDAIDAVIPGMIGPGEHQISLDDIRTFSGLAAVVGLAGVLYAGLGWVSALRRALATVFEVPDGEQPGFLAGKVRDLLALVVLGTVLLPRRGPHRLRGRLLRRRPRLAGPGPRARLGGAAAHRRAGPGRRDAGLLLDVPAARRAARSRSARCGTAPCSARSPSRCSSRPPGCC